MGTWTQYNCALTKWKKFCTDRSLEMWDANVKNVICFLTDLYTQELSYGTLNTARSALSTILGKVDGVALGEHKLVIDFMKGISKPRPAAPRYHVTWNPDLVLKVLSSWDT